MIVYINDRYFHKDIDFTVTEKTQTLLFLKFHSKEATTLVFKYLYNDKYLKTNDANPLRYKLFGFDSVEDVFLFELVQTESADGTPV